MGGGGALARGGGELERPTTTDRAVIGVVALACVAATRVFLPAYRLPFRPRAPSCPSPRRHTSSLLLHGLSHRLGWRWPPASRHEAPGWAAAALAACTLLSDRPGGQTRARSVYHRPPATTSTTYTHPPARPRTVQPQSASAPPTAPPPDCHPPDKAARAVAATLGPSRREAPGRRSPRTGGPQLPTRKAEQALAPTGPRLGQLIPDQSSTPPTTPARATALRLLCIATAPPPGTPPPPLVWRCHPPGLAPGPVATCAPCGLSLLRPDHL